MSYNSATHSPSRYSLIDLVDRAKVVRLLNQFAALHQISILLLKGDARELETSVLAASVHTQHTTDAQFTRRQIHRGESLLALLDPSSSTEEGAQPWSLSSDGTAYKYIPIEVAGQVMATLLVGFVHLDEQADSKLESESESKSTPERFSSARFKQILSHLRTVIELVINDATHRLQVEENKRALTLSDRRYRAYFQDSPDAIMVIDDRGGIMEVNPQTTKLTGYSNYDLMGLSLYDLVSDGHLERIVTFLEKIRHLQTMSIELRFLRSNGSEFFVELSGAVLSEHEYLLFLKDISLRKEVEIEVQNRVDYFHRVFYNNPSPMLLIDPKTWKVTTFNARFQDVTGLTADQISGLSLRESDLFLLEEWEHCIEQLDTIGFVKEASLQMRGHDQPLRETLLSAEVFELLGEAHCIATFFDVTERNEAERALALSEQRLRAITDNISGMVVQYFFYPDQPPKLCYVSRGAIPLLGLEPEAIIDNPKMISDLILPEDLRHLSRTHLEAYLTQQNWESEFRVQRQDAETPRWIHATASTLRVERGKVAWIAYLQDVTEKKFAIEHLRRSEQKMAFYLQHNPLPYIELSAELEVVEWNRAAQTLFGYSSKEATGRSLLDLIVPEELKSRALGIFDLLRKQVGGEREELVNLSRHQQRYICEWYSTAITNAQGVLAGIAILVRDVTEQRLLEGALREHRDHLEQLIDEQLWEIKAGKEIAERSSRAKSDFLYTMSKTLRDPLHSILAFSELYLDNPSQLPHEKKDHYAEHIRSSALQLLPVLEDLSDLTRIDLGEITFTFAPHDLGELVEETIETFRASSEDYSDTLFEVSSVDFSLVVPCDADRIRHVLINLFQNAVKFSPAPAEIKIRYYRDNLDRVTPTGRHQERAITVEVRDHGIGIPEDQMSRVFDQADSNERNRYGFSGAGLGLALCREFIEQHRGKIGAFNAEGGGVAITFTLPL